MLSVYSCDRESFHLSAVVYLCEIFGQMMLQDGRVGSGDSAPWMVGVMGREACERLLMERGTQRDFVIRGSKNLVKDRGK
jgi:hypothetical protein